RRGFVEGAELPPGRFAEVADELVRRVPLRALSVNLSAPDAGELLTWRHQGRLRRLRVTGGHAVPGFIQALVEALDLTGLTELTPSTLHVGPSCGQRPRWPPLAGLRRLPFARSRPRAEGLEEVLGGKGPARLRFLGIRGGGLDHRALRAVFR